MAVYYFFVFVCPFQMKVAPGFSLSYSALVMLPVLAFGAVGAAGVAAFAAGAAALGWA